MHGHMKFKNIRPFSFCTIKDRIVSRGSKQV